MIAGHRIKYLGAGKDPILSFLYHKVFEIIKILSKNIQRTSLTLKYLTLVIKYINHLLNA